MLEEYAAFPLFRTVGIDSSFYAPPTEETLAAYAKHLPPGFPCVSKVWNQLTVHTFSKAQDQARAGQTNPDFLNPDLFLEAVYEPYRRDFADHAGPFVFEFQAIGRGSGMTPERFADRLDEFFSALPREGQYAVEIRNEEFLTPDVLRGPAGARRGPRLQLVDPHARDRRPARSARRGVGAVHRGPRAAPARAARYDEAVDAFAPYDRIREPSPPLRRDLLRLIETAVHTRIPAYLLVNNRAEGSAPLTIAEVLRACCRRRRRSMGDRASLHRYAVISILAALATIVLKGGAYLITGSVGLLSDALESLVNLAAAIVAFIALSAAARPEDEDHRYGHSKAGVLLQRVRRRAHPAGRRQHHLRLGAPPARAAADRADRHGRRHRGGGVAHQSASWPGCCSGRAAGTSPSRSRPTPTTS